MIKRLISGILGGALLVTLIALGGVYYTLGVGIMVTLCILEYSELLRRQKLRPHTEALLAISLLLLVLVEVIASQPGRDPWAAIHTCERALGLMMVVAFVVILLLELIRGNPEQGLVNAAANFFGIVYIALMLAYTLLLRFVPDGLVYVFFAMLVTWTNDSCAYFIGSHYGKHKLAPRISPKKSVEGALAGLAGGMLVAIVITLVTAKPFWPMLALGILTVAAGQFGDLVESIIKRNAGVKDSGSFLPGHGGALDRFDSILLAAPAVYFVVAYVFPYL
jgi:phosphatidate cytidylyltransferase